MIRYKFSLDQWKSCSFWNLLYGHVCFPLVQDIYFRCSWQLRYFNERTFENNNQWSKKNYHTWEERGSSMVFQGPEWWGFPGFALQILIPAQRSSHLGLVVDLACSAELKGWNLVLGPCVKVLISSLSVGRRVKIQERVIGSGFFQILLFWDILILLTNKWWGYIPIFRSIAVH